MSILLASLLALAAIAALYVAYQAGRRATQYPSEDEMIVRLKIINDHRKLEAREDADLSSASL
jgi:hypothetical protein